MRLVNCARGIYEEADLTQLLDEGVLGGVARMYIQRSHPPRK